MKVIIVGVGQPAESISKVITANQELGCDIIVVDDNKRFVAEFTEVTKSLNLVEYKPADMFIQPKSKYHK